jgi:hypothetical protein
MNRRPPLPLGGNVIRRDLGPAAISTLSGLLRDSIAYGLEHRQEAVDYAMQFGRGLDRKLTDKFVGMYVNGLTLDYGDRGREAVRRLLDDSRDAIRCRQRDERPAAVAGVYLFGRTWVSMVPLWRMSRRMARVPARIDFEPVDPREERVQLAHAFSEARGSRLQDIRRLHLEQPVVPHGGNRRPAWSATDRAFFTFLPHHDAKTTSDHAVRPPMDRRCDRGDCAREL